MARVPPVLMFLMIEFLKAIGTSQTVESNGYTDFLWILALKIFHFCRGSTADN